jgi:general secretion pathway protein L
MTQPFTTILFRWWVERLAELVPANWLTLLAKSSDAAILDLQGDGFTLHVRRDGTEALVARGTLPDLKSVLTSVTNLPQMLLLRVAPDRGLCKKLSVPLAARRDLKTLLGFEIDRESPFEQSEVYWNFMAGAQDKARGKLDVDLVIVPRSIADAAIAAARDAGFDPAALEVDVGAGKPVLIWIAAQPGMRRILPYRKLIPLAAVTGGLAAALVILSFAGQQWSLFIADRTISQLRGTAQEASGLQQAANHRLASIRFLGRGGDSSALAVLAAATRTLPDDTYLSSLGLHDGHVTMSGYSESAASLIGRLEKSSSFRDPVFDSPLTEAEESDEEKFTISMSLAPADSS